MSYIYIIMKFIFYHIYISKRNIFKSCKIEKINEELLITLIELKGHWKDSLYRTHYKKLNS